MKWVEDMIEECEFDIRCGLDHSLHNAPGRIRIAEIALERMTDALRRLSKTPSLELARERLERHKSDCEELDRQNPRNNEQS